MATDKAFLEYVISQLSDLEGITYRAMMGEYVLYYQGRIAGGLYDNRLLIKPVPSAIAYMKEPVFETPYPGAKDMLAADVDDRERLNGLFEAMFDELPVPKKRKLKKKPVQ